MANSELLVDFQNAPKYPGAQEFSVLKHDKRKGSSFVHVQRGMNIPENTSQARIVFATKLSTMYTLSPYK